MTDSPAPQLFVLFRSTGDRDALARVFDLTASRALDLARRVAQNELVPAPECRLAFDATSPPRGVAQNEDVFVRVEDTSGRAVSERKVRVYWGHEAELRCGLAPGRYVVIVRSHHTSVRSEFDVREPSGTSQVVPVVLK
jgi:hypothetical protein